MIIVRLEVKADRVDDFLKLVTFNASESRKEPGNLRFDVLQSADDPASFLLYEAYDSPESAAAHKKTQHYAVWRDTVAPWMAEPRRGIPYKSIKP